MSSQPTCGTDIGLPRCPEPTSTVATSAPTSTSTSVTTTATSSSITSTTGASSNTTSPPISSSTSTANPTSTPDSGLSGGAVAGIAVGCLIAGILAGVVVAWFLLRRRRRRRQKHAVSSSTRREIIEPKKGSPVSITPQGNSHPAVAGVGSKFESELVPFLLDGVADGELAAEVESLGELIHQHVESNYHSDTIQCNVKTLGPMLAALGLGQNHVAGTEYLAALCTDPKTRQIGLRHIISYVLFRSIDFQHPGETMMLPFPVSAFLQSLPMRNGQENESRGIPLAMSSWRKDTAFLLHPAPSERTALPFPESTANLQAGPLVKTLGPFLQHFTGSQTKSSQQKHLEAVAIECARLGYKVFSHPNDWQFVYTSDGTKDGNSIVVCPGLEKLSGRDGTWYNHPKGVLKPGEWQLR